MFFCAKHFWSKYNFTKAFIACFSLKLNTKCVEGEMEKKQNNIWVTVLLNLVLAVECKASFSGKEITKVLVNDKIDNDFNLGLSLPFFSHFLLLLCFGVPVKSENKQ